MTNNIQPRTQTCAYHGNVGNSIAYCHNPAIRGKSVSLEQCRACNLFETRQPGQTSAIRIDNTPSLPCVHRGSESRHVECKTCGGSTMLPVLQCDLHGECSAKLDDWNRIRANENGTKVKACAKCKDREDPEAFTVDENTENAIQQVKLHGTAGKVREVPGAIRVGFLTPVLAIGGVERWLVTLAKHTPQLQWQGVAVHEGGTLDARTLREVSGLMPVSHDRVKLLSECDIVLTWAEGHCPQLNDFGGKVVHVIHGCLHWSRSCASVNKDRVDHYIGVAPLASELAPSGKPFTTILNSIEPARLIPTGTREELRERHGIGQREIVVGYVGRYSREKNPLLAAEAAKQIKGRSVYCSVGQHPAWQQRVKRTDPGVVFLSPENPADCYVMADVFVMGSQGEPFGIVFPEAWFMGCPVVSHTCGVVPIAEEYAGCRLTERIGDHKRIGDAIEAAIANRERLAISRQVVEDHFMPQRMADEYVAIFETVYACQSRI